MPIQYPTTKEQDLVEEIYGQAIPDPYRWMEDLDSDDLRQWIDAQNELTFGFLENSPLREKIQKRMTALWNYEKYSSPFKRPGRYFFFYNNGLQNQDVL
ncbi:MAG: S9 family peptidase, partial [Anaerolineales bacterium]